MTPNSVIHGDAIEVLKTLPDKSVDLILTDIPYGTTDNEWDILPELSEFFPLVHSKLKDGRAFITTCRNPVSAELIVANKRNFKHGWVWNKSQAGGWHLAKYRPLQITEDVLVFSDGTVYYQPIMTKGKMISKGGQKDTPTGFRSVSFAGLKIRKPHMSDEYYPKNILDIPLQRFEGGHPTQKPVALFEYLIRTYSNEGDTVLDCYAGSGTTAIACINSNRKYILVEKDQKYYEMAKARIEKHQQQGVLPLAA